MIIMRQWIEEDVKHRFARLLCTGFYLFGIIPLYISKKLP